MTDATDLRARLRRGADRPGEASPATDAESDPGTLAVRLVGERSAVLDAGDVADLPWQTRTVTVACASGKRTAATWRGVGLLDALAVVGVPGQTTHVAVASEDGYRACVDVLAASDGLLALVRDGAAIGDRRPYWTRLVAPGIEGARTVKGVASVEAVALAPDEDPESYEDLQLDEDDD